MTRGQVELSCMLVREHQRISSRDCCSEFLLKDRVLTRSVNLLDEKNLADAPLPLMNLSKRRVILVFMRRIREFKSLPQKFERTGK